MFHQNTNIIFFSPPSCRWFAGCNIPAQQVKICQLGGGMNSPPGKSHITKNKCYMLSEAVFIDGKSGIIDPGLEQRRPFHSVISIAY
jgi:hypothetical protein